MSVKPRRRKAPVQPGTRYKCLLAWRDAALCRIAAGEKSLASLDKQIAQLERCFKDQTGEWQKERQATKAGRNAAIRRRKQEFKDVKAYAKLINAPGVYILWNSSNAHVGWHLGISSEIIYLFGKGWFKGVSIVQGGRGWYGTPVAFGRPEEGLASLCFGSLLHSLKEP